MAAVTDKILIDADPGIGDAVALTLAILDPSLDVLGITATAGCVSGLLATRNANAVVELLDPVKWPRIGWTGLDAPLASLDAGPSVRDPADLNGPTGLGETEFRSAELHRPRESAKVMVDLVRNYPNQVTLLTLGPLTNVAMASELAPDFLGMLNRLVCQGGAIQSGGDVTATSEFNMFSDPVSARKVLRSPATKVLVPLDVSNRVVLTYEQFDRLANVAPQRLAWLFENLLSFSLRANHEHLGLEGVRLHEVVALACAVKPGLFGTEAMAIDIETKGELTRGMTVCDQRGIMRWQHNIDVATSVDTQGVLDYFAGILKTSATA